MSRRLAGYCFSSTCMPSCQHFLKLGYYCAWLVYVQHLFVQNGFEIEYRQFYGFDLKYNNNCALYLALGDQFYSYYSALEKCDLISIGNLKPFLKCLRKPKQFLSSLLSKITYRILGKMGHILVLNNVTASRSAPCTPTQVLGEYPPTQKLGQLFHTARFY